MASATNTAPMEVQHTPTTAKELDALLCLADLWDGDRLRLDFESRRTGVVLSIVLRREVHMSCGRLGCTGFWADVLDMDRFQYVCMITNAEPFRGWSVGRTSKNCKVQNEDLLRHVRWLLCALFILPHGLDILISECRIHATVRFANQDNARAARFRS